MPSAWYLVRSKSARNVMHVILGVHHEWANQREGRHRPVRSVASRAVSREGASPNGQQTG